MVRRTSTLLRIFRQVSLLLAPIAATLVERDLTAGSALPATVEPKPLRSRDDRD